MPVCEPADDIGPGERVIDVQWLRVASGPSLGAHTKANSITSDRHGRVFAGGRTILD